MSWLQSGYRQTARSDPGGTGKRLQAEKGDAGAIVAGGTRQDEVDEDMSDEE